MRWYHRLYNWIKQCFNIDTPVVTIKLLTDDPQLMPVKAHESDAGYDLRSANDKPIVIYPGRTVMIPCGFAMELPLGHEGQIRPRSGLALKNGITVLNSPGTIDCNYRGEVCVLLTNLGQHSFKVYYGMRVAQLVICKLPEVHTMQVTKLSGSDRDRNGFGSTGVR